MTHELIRLGLIVRVKPAGFAADGRRVAAAYMFQLEHACADSKVVVLDQRRKPPA